MWRQVLADQGVVVDVVDRHHVRVTDESSSTTEVLWFRRSDRPLPASKVPSAPEAGLLAVPRGTDAFMERARRAGWSVVTDEGAIDLIIGERRILTSRHENGDPAPARPGVVPWPLYSTVRVLAALTASQGPELQITQHRLAASIGASQPTVSRCLKRLAADGVVSTAASKIQLDDLQSLIDWWMRNYRGPGGITSYWYGLDSPTDQAAAAIDVLSSQLGGAGHRVGVSGEVAADLLAPYQRPGSVRIYVRRAESLSRAGLVPVVSPGDATLQVTVPDDPGLWLPTPWPIPQLGVTAGFADPLTILHDLREASSPTADEASAHLLSQLVGPLAGMWARARLEFAP